LRKKGREVRDHRRGADGFEFDHGPAGHEEGITRGEDGRVAADRRPEKAAQDDLQDVMFDRLAGFPCARAEMDLANPQALSLESLAEASGRNDPVARWVPALNLQHLCLEVGPPAKS